MAQGNLVPNGDFESDVDGDGLPDFWTTAGAPQIKQQLVRDRGWDGKGFSGKLICTEFGDGTPASHAMICQLGTIGVQKGKWYRLTLWAKAEDIKAGLVRVALVNTRIWDDVGLQDAFNPNRRWQKYEFYFQATSELRAEDSRLQIWFTSTGSLWLDDVELQEIPSFCPQRFPQIPTKGVKNFLPNSSFECGTAGWGSYSSNIFWWEGNIYRLMGELDDKSAVHGKFSLKMSLSKREPEIFYFDYLDPVHQLVDTLLVANQGWIPVERGRPYTLSAYIKADRSTVKGVLFVRQANGRRLQRTVDLAINWERYSFTFAPQDDFIWIGVGFDLSSSDMKEATVWVDAVQLEAGSQASDYQPRREVEVMADTRQDGNIFLSEGEKPSILLNLHAYAEGEKERKREISVNVSVKDFYDVEVLRKRVNLSVPLGRGINKPVSLPVGKLGFYRITIETEGFSQSLRCAIIKPYKGKDSRWGMNHAYPWQFLLRLAHQVGILWWRDWSVQWRLVQAEESKEFDFKEPDIQIDRVIKENGKVLVLFPFPSAEWSSSGNEEQIERIEPLEYRRREMFLACKPKDEEAFAKYIAESVKHYRNRVNAYHILNEPLYTFYSLPARLGHTLDDYIRLLRIAYETIKANQPEAKVVGGIGIWADNQWTRNFVDGGGLRWVDVLDLHLYSGGNPDGLCDSLEKLWNEMKRRGEAKPIWLTEIGCYADDDPPVVPFKSFFGDSAMRSALHSDERAASEWLVKFATMFFANGGGKIFLHAGTCGEINGVDAGGVFFEYGGTPRKIYPVISAMANLLPPEAVFEKKERREGIIIYWFRNGKERIGVAWSENGKEHKFQLPKGMRAFDIMGNPISDRLITINDTPVYFEGL